VTTFLEILIFGPLNPVSAAAAALISSNAQCSTAFCVSDEKYLKLKGQHF
jgi:hypothetical protein